MSLSTDSWDEVNRGISDELCVNKEKVIIQYLDDEDDWITVYGNYLKSNVSVCILHTMYR